MTVRLVLPGLLSVALFAQAPPQVPPVSTPRPAAARPAVAGRAGAAPSYRDLKFPPLRLIEPPQPTRLQLSNGMKVLLLEDHETPLVTITALVRTGTLFDPADRVGLASITGSLMRMGGAGQRTPDRLDADLEALGASLESSIGESTGTVTLSTLRQSLAESLAIYFDVLSEPGFRQDKLDFLKATASIAIRHRNDDARDLTRREFQAALFGRDSAIARRAELSTVARISRADVVAFHKRHFFPANIVLTVAGDFDSGSLKESLETVFGRWKAQQPVPELPKVDSRAAPGAFLAVKPDLRESYLAVGLLEGAFHEPDRAAIEIAATALGIGQNCRLVRRAREAQGSIREIRADWVTALGRPGIFMVNASGPTPAAGETVQIILEEIRKLRSAEITDEELRTARESSIARLVAGFDSKLRQLGAIANLEYFGYPADSQPQFQKALAAVTRAEVLRVAKERLDPEKMTVVVVSNLSNFNKPLDPRGGAPTPIDLTVAAPATGPTTATADAAALGKRLMARAQQAAGGVDKLSAVKDFTQTATYNGEDGVRETQTDRWLGPAYLRQDMQSSRAGMIVRYTDGESGWISNGRASSALTGYALRQAREEILRAYVPMLLTDRLPGRAVAALDDQTVEISWGDLTGRVVFDPQTGLPSKLLYEITPDRQAVLFVEEEYSDFRDVAGIKVPFSIQVRRNGIKYASGSVGDFKVNVGLRPEVLQRRP